MQPEIAELEGLLLQLEAEETGWSPELIAGNQRLRAFHGPALRQIVAAVLASHPPMPPLVDLGAGDGALRRLLPDEWADRVIEVEPVAELAWQNRRQSTAATVVRAIGEQLPLADGAVGTVLALTLFDILEQPQAVAREVARVLAPGGRLIHFHDLAPNPFAALYPVSNRLAVPRMRGRQVDGFMLVKWSELRRRRNELAPEIWQLLQLAQRVPLAFERLMQDGMDLLRVISQAIAGLRGLPKQQTPALFVTMTRLMRQHLTEVGLEVTFAGSQSARSVQPADSFHLIGEATEDLAALDEQIKRLGEPLGIQLPNRYKSDLGEMTMPVYDEDLAAEIGPDKLQLDLSVHVMVARKL